MTPNPIEEELRAAFARHEPQTPAPGPLSAKLETAFVRAKRRRTLRRCAGAAAALVLVTAPAPVVLERLRSTGTHTSPASLMSAAPAPTVAGPLDVLLVGRDETLPRDPDRRGDTVVLAHVPADRSAVYLVSFSRTGEVRGGDGREVRLADTLEEDAAALPGVIAQLTGVDLDATITMRLDALGKVLATTGPVEVCLPVPADTSPDSGTGSRAAADRRAFEAGCQPIGEDDVTQLFRARYGMEHGVHDRDRNVQRFLRALVSKTAADGTLTDPVRVAGLVTAAGDGLAVDGDPAVLLTAAGALSSAEIVGVNQVAATADRELYPGTGPGLYAAIRDDELAGWARAHPDHLLE